MNQNKELFTYEVKKHIAGSSRYDPKNGGKWIIFYRKASFKLLWDKIKNLYRTKKLEGIDFLQASKDLLGSEPNSFRMVGFICGPADNLNLMEWYGSKLMSSLNSLGPFDVDCMIYIRGGGTLSTSPGSAGKTNSVLSSLEVPVEWRADSHHCLASQHPRSAVDMTAKNSSIGAPMRTKDQLYLTETISDIKGKYTYQESEGGKWMLFYEKSNMDYIWSKACQLYRSSQLTGVQSLSVSTAKKNPRAAFEELSVIMFHCGPYSNEENMKKYGRNILKLMHSYGPFDWHHMPYKTNIQSKLGSVATGSKNNSIYTLQIPEAWFSEYCKKLEANQARVSRRSSKTNPDSSNKAELRHK